MVLIGTAISSTAQGPSKSPSVGSLNVKIQYEDPIRNQHYP